MITEVMDRALRRFEERNVQPGIIKKAGPLLRRLVQNGLRPEVITAIQQQRLGDTIRYVATHSPFYRRMFTESGIHPDDIRSISDLEKLPFTTAGDLRQWEEFLCVPEEKLAAVYTTSGTTGEPKRVYYTFREIQALSNLYGIAVRLAHQGRLIALIAMPVGHGLWIGGASVQRAVERAGGLPLNVGADDPRETIKWMQRFAPNILFSSTSYLTALTREAQQSGFHMPLDKIILAGELVTAEHKAVFSQYWGAAVFDSYGSTEIGGAQTIAMPECCAFHLNDFHLITEIIDPVSGKPSQEGELVFTTIRREGMPLVRYRSGDKAQWAECGCWLPLQAVTIKGRTDDMIVAGDMNFYGRVIADAVGRVPGSTGRVAVMVEKEGLADKITVKAEGQADRTVVENALLAEYPQLMVNTKNGSLLLAIEIVQDLGKQIKNVKVHDLR